MAQVVRRLLLKSQADQISHMLPATRHRYNLDVWALVQSRGDGHRTLVTPERALSDYNEDFIFFRGANERLEGQTYTKYNKINNKSENFRGRGHFLKMLLFIVFILHYVLQQATFIKVCYHQKYLLALPSKVLPTEKCFVTSFWFIFLNQPIIFLNQLKRTATTKNIC